jgi:surface antigen
MHQGAATVPPEYLTRQHPSTRVGGNGPIRRWIALAFVVMGVATMGVATMGVAACSMTSAPPPVAGNTLSAEDQQRASAAQIQALETSPSGAAVSWSNPETGRYGNIVPGPAYVTNGFTCRQYTDTRYIDGNTLTERSTGCRNPDGTWTMAK